MEAVQRYSLPHFFYIAIVINEVDWVIGSLHSLILFNMQASFLCNKHKNTVALLKDNPNPTRGFVYCYISSIFDLIYAC